MIVGTVCTGTKFPSPQYVNNLYAMMRRNITRAFTFLCITDNPKGFHPKIVTKKPANNVWGWWHFMEFYSADIGDSWYENEPRVYFGLDTVIRDNIDFVLERKKQTLSLDFNYLVGNPNLMLANTWADCAAVIPAGGLPWLYKAFLKEHKETGIGTDEYRLIHVWVTRRLIEARIKPDLWQNIHPGAMCSYKWPSPKIEEPTEPMIFFHGEPMIHEILGVSPWIKKYWHAEDI